MNIKLPFWLSGPNIQSLKRAATAWWQSVKQWLSWPLSQLDAEQCSQKVLVLLAWQRDIERFDNEPEWLFRRRVQFAFINSKDAGSVAGFIRIFERLGIGSVELEERNNDRDWDVIKILVNDSQLSDNPELLRILIQQYGRTCRRYELTTPTTVPFFIQCHAFGDDRQAFLAK